MPKNDSLFNLWGGRVVGLVCVCVCVCVCVRARVCACACVHVCLRVCRVVSMSVCEKSFVLLCPAETLSLLISQRILSPSPFPSLSPPLPCSTPKVCVCVCVWGGGVMIPPWWRAAQSHHRKMHRCNSDTGSYLKALVTDLGKLTF